MGSWIRFRTVLPLLFGLALSATACNAPDEQDLDDDAAEVTPADSSRDAAAAAAAPAAPATGTRAALPALFSIMVGLQGDLDRISHSLWTESYDSIAAAAERAANHPGVTPEEASLIAGVLGPDMARFQGLDQKVHDLSVQLAEQARARDLDAVLETDGRLRAGCVECHTAFRERLRDGVGR